jgi:hypothetical protein
MQLWGLSMIYLCYLDDLLQRDLYLVSQKYTDVWCSMVLES